MANLQKQVEGFVTLVTRAGEFQQGLAVPGVAAAAAGSLEGGLHTPRPGCPREASPERVTTSSLSGGRTKQARVVAADSAGASPGASVASTSGARPSGDNDHLALLGQGIVDSSASRGKSTRLFANDGEIEKEYFLPVLVQANLARRSLRRA